MKKMIVFSIVSCLACAATAQTLQLPQIAAYPKPMKNLSWLCNELLSKGQTEKVVPPNELDVRTCDISSLDFTAYTAEELADILTFDTKTKFPPKKKLPKGFSPKKILKNGKNPGLGVKKLHKKGITGKGVSIAVIDQNMLIGHKEYPQNVVYYEEDQFWQLGQPASMHAPAVVSIAAGKTAGVAPKAIVFELAHAFGEELPNDRYDARPMAAMLRRVIALNKQLAPGQKIRVVSISRGFSKDDLGAEEFNTARQALEKDGVAVFTTNDVFTLSRNHSSDNPENVSSYCRPAYWFEKQDVPFYNHLQNSVIVPTDFRVIASPTGTKDYVHYANGGLSWAVPYAAGLYALGVQVYPNLTKEIFIQKALETATLQHCTYRGVDFSTKIVNPANLLDALNELNLQ